uniref:Glucan endo-1,3-beta-D-glucosidase n=1 Tax=Oryza meridionalis TaxID=40149 RepID=A0A0E0D3L6_9ORYZ
MAAQGVASVYVLAILTLLVGLLASIQTVQSAIGVCYGTHGDNLPAPGDVVQLYQSNHIDAMRIYLPNDTILHALRGTRIAVVLDAPDVRSLASDDDINTSSSAAQAWVQANGQQYYIKYIAVGNEVKGGDKPKILPAMNNIRDALSAAGLGGHIRVSTAVEMSAFACSPLPSGSAFADPSIMGPIVKFLASNGSPLLANAARVYNQNLINHVEKGTPKRPVALETYIFTMFDENQKGDAIGKHFGLFNPDKSPVYSINFSITSDSGLQSQPSMGWASRPAFYALQVKDYIQHSSR